MRLAFSQGASAMINAAADYELMLRARDDFPPAEASIKRVSECKLPLCRGDRCPILPLKFCQAVRCEASDGGGGEVGG